MLGTETTCTCEGRGAIRPAAVWSVGLERSFLSAAIVVDTLGARKSAAGGTTAMRCLSDLRIPTTGMLIADAAAEGCLSGSPGVQETPATF